MGIRTLSWLGLLAPAVAQATDDHRVRGRFEGNGTFRELTFAFEVSPPVMEAPRVALLAEVTIEEPTYLVVADNEGRYTVTLGDLEEGARGRLLVEVWNGELDEPHLVDFAVRPHRRDAAGSSCGSASAVIRDSGSRSLRPAGPRRSRR